MTAISSKAAAAAAEWDPMYAGGQQPFGAGPFLGVDGLLRKWVKTGVKVLDVGAGYGRDSLWMARELSCSVTAIEPGQSGGAQGRGGSRQRACAQLLRERVRLQLASCHV
jgi:2-polyprenyl-3-methyl-5-hydroxy-6-metoxy-1,4-benzoquinol methylase